MKRGKWIQEILSGASGRISSRRVMGSWLIFFVTLAITFLIYKGKTDNVVSLLESCLWAAVGLFGVTSIADAVNYRTTEKIKQGPTNEHHSEVQESYA